MPSDRSEDLGAPEPIPAVSVALVRGLEVLVVKRRFAPSRGLYAFPGGRVEKDESLEAAARRELHEETGLDAGPLMKVADLLVGSSDTESAVCYRLHVFHSSYVGGEPASADDAEEALFVTLDELRRLPLTGSVEEIATALLSGAEPGD